MKIDSLEIVRRKDMVVFDLRLHKEIPEDKLYIEEAHKFLDRSLKLKNFLNSELSKKANKETIISGPYLRPKDANKQIDHIIVFTVVCLKREKEIIVSEFNKGADFVDLEIKGSP